MAAASPDMVTRDEIEAWLRQIMVPVEPEDDFVNKLKARLVRVRGGGWFSTAWAIIGAVAVATVLLMAIFSLALRAFLSLLSLIGLLERRPVQGRGKQASTA